MAWSGDSKDVPHVRDLCLGHGNSSRYFETTIRHDAHVLTALNCNGNCLSMTIAINSKGLNTKKS